MNGTTTPPALPSGDTTPPPSPRTGLKVYAVVMTIFFAISLFANILLLVLAIAAFAGGEERSRRGKLKELVVGGDEEARDKIAVIDVEGIVSGSGRNDGMVGDVKMRLKQALADNDVKAIVLKIDSPGGEVTASDTLYQELKKAREKKPVIAFINSLGASGAYYLSMGTTEVMCSETAITGSIGVIAEAFNVSGLMEKVGVSATTFKSGRNKDMMNPFKKPDKETEAQGKIMQGLIEDMYERFVGIVARERQLNVDDLRKELADGRVLLAQKAKDARLIDSVGSFEDAIAAAKKRGGVSAAREIKYEAPGSIGAVFEIFGSKASAPAVQVELLPRDFHLEAGRLYYLSHHLGF